MTRASVTGSRRTTRTGAKVVVVVCSSTTFSDLGLLRDFEDPDDLRLRDLREDPDDFRLLAIALTTFY
jgi:hypothetical protein